MLVITVTHTPLTLVQIKEWQIMLQKITVYTLDKKKKKRKMEKTFLHGTQHLLVHLELVHCVI